ncbi:hypothetical protein BDZ91DRAFT_762482 [Kalaharituber pfeilii]|nr:hypothetical protein BDZ91DRAFT_762482 [Kalaharituber pfeilii]
MATLAPELKGDICIYLRSTYRERTLAWRGENSARANGCRTGGDEDPKRWGGGGLDGRGEGRSRAEACGRPHAKSLWASLEGRRSGYGDGNRKGTNKHYIRQAMQQASLATGHEEPLLPYEYCTPEAYDSTCAAVRKVCGVTYAYRNPRSERSQACMPSPPPQHSYSTCSPARWRSIQDHCFQKQ